MMSVKLIVYDGVKYDRKSKRISSPLYHNIQSYEVVTGDRATAIGLETDESSRDEYNEYLIITDENGETHTFRNSHVDLFKY